MALIYMPEFYLTGSMDQPIQNNCHPKKLILLPIILGLSLIISSGIIGFVLYQNRMLDNSLQVTGSAKVVVTSDVVKWNTTFSRSVGVSELKSGYNQMASDLEKVKTFLKGEGISDDDMNTSVIYLNQQYDYSKGSSNLTGYELRQTIQIQSTDINKITELAKSTQRLIDEGVIFYTQSLEYYYTKLPETRVELLADAVKDAQNRAEKIAQTGGQKVGSLKSASVGVVQVMPVNSVEISDYGTYDTSSIEKEVMITVKAIFRIK